MSLSLFFFLVVRDLELTSLAITGFAYDDGALLGGLMGGAGGGEVRVGKIPFFNAFEDDFDLDKL